MDSLLSKLFSKLWKKPQLHSTKGISSAARSEYPRDLEWFTQRLGNAKNVIVMCGAGLSVSAGIPDFRTPGTGLYSKLASYNLPYPEAVFEIEYFRSNPEPFRRLACELWPGNLYFPTVGHYFIKMLNDKGILLRCYSQNIDSLETMAGLPPAKLVAAHGNFDTATCVETRVKVPISEVREAYLKDAHGQLNERHGTTLVKPDIVFFGEALPDRYFELSKTDFAKCDMLIVLGTSLKVQPFASLIEHVATRTPRLLINREMVGVHPYGFDFFRSDTSDVFYEGECDDGCMRIARLMKWDSELNTTVAEARSRQKGSRKSKGEAY